LIIDAHCHLADKDWYSDTWWNELAKLYVHPLKYRYDMDMTPQEIVEKIMPDLFDPTGEKLDSKVSIEEQNQIHGEIQKKYPKRILSYASVDPRRPGADKLIRKAFEEWKMSGLKIHPGTGFYPNSKEVYRLLDVANEFKKSVLFHVGQMVQPLRSKYCDPVYLDDVCLDYPDLWIQAAHMGWGSRYELFRLGFCKTNLIVDFSGWQPDAQANYHEFCASLRECLNNFSAERVLWGTDNPYMRGILPDKDWIQMINDLPLKAPEGITFTQEEVDAMLGGNAQRIFGIV
jgi:predicted TIM-barrel fold metal-dependent hydrolase